MPHPKTTLALGALLAIAGSAQAQFTVVGDIAYTDNVTTTTSYGGNRTFSVEYDGRTYTLLYAINFIGSSHYAGNLRVNWDEEATRMVLRSATGDPYTTLLDLGASVSAALPANTYNEYGGIPITIGTGYGYESAPQSPYNYHDMPAMGQVWYAGMRDAEGRNAFFELEWDTEPVELSGYYHDSFFPSVRGFAVQTEPGGEFVTFDISQGPIVEPVYCAADFDQDGDVDFGDFGAFVAAFDTFEGDANWNAQCDLDQDGDVDFGDFGAFVSQFDMTTEDCEG